MKDVLTVFGVVFLVLSILTGCATMSPTEFTAWTIANKEIAQSNVAAGNRPTFDLSLTLDGRVSGIKVYAQPVMMPYIAQKDPSPWVRTVDKLISVGGFLGGGIIVGNAMKGILDDVGKNAGHNTAISGSYNTDRHDSGDYRDIGALTDDHSNRSINDSYNPTDRHDVTDSYNPIDRHDTTDRHDEYQSPYNPISNTTTP